MSQEIIIEGSTQEIAEKIAQYPGQIIRAILVVEEIRGEKLGGKLIAADNSAEDSWTRDFREWAASHRHLDQPADDGRDSLYRERLG